MSAKDQLERAIKSALIMPHCQLSVMPITPSYLEEYLLGHIDVITQVRTAKMLSQPVILMIENDLTPYERQQVENIFRNHNVVAKIEFDRNNIEECADKLLEALKPYGAKKK